MQIKIKFSQSDLKKRAAACLNSEPRRILHVSPTLGGRSYMVLREKEDCWYVLRQRIDYLTVWQIVDAIPLQESSVSGEWNLAALGSVRQLCEMFQFETIPESFSEVKARYRQLSKDCHPDLGGSAAAFISLRLAKDRWRRFFGI
jgi:hypothetical protein